MNKIYKFIAVFFLFVSIQGSVAVIDPAKNAIDHNKEGLLYLKDGYYYAAIQEFKLAINLNPDNPVTANFYNNLGGVYLKIKKYDWAIECYESAIYLNPNFLKYYRNLAGAYSDSKKIVAGIEKYLEMTADSNQDNKIISWITLGYLYKEVNDKKSSDYCFKRAYNLSEDFSIKNALKGHISK